MTIFHESLATGRTEGRDETATQAGSIVAVRRAGQITGAAGKHAPESPIAAAGHMRGSSPAAGGELYLVHRGFDTADLQEAKALLETLS
jgi:hypothetical protein